MVEVPITIVNSDLIEQYKSNGQIIYPYVSFSPHSVTGTPTQACPASYKTHPVNTVKVDADNFQYEVEIPTGLNPFQVKTIWLFDQEDQLIGYATVDLPYLGSAKLSVRLLVNYTGWPGADPWENMNQMVQNEVNVLETWKANAEDISTGIPRLWNQTIYVDQLNGDDSNPGTSDAPVKTLQKAFDMVPSGGAAEIRLLSDYIIDTFVNGRDKVLNVRIQKNDATLVNIYQKIQPVGNYNTAMSFTNLAGSITFYRCNLDIIDESDPAKGFDSYVQFISRGKHKGSVVAVSLLYTTVNLASLSNHTYFKTDGVFSPNIAISLYSSVIKQNAGRFLDIGGVASLSVDNSSYVENGTWADVISRIIRDIDGKPRNLIANFVI